MTDKSPIESIVEAKKTAAITIEKEDTRHLERRMSELVSEMQRTNESAETAWELNRVLVEKNTALRVVLNWILTQCQKSDLAELKYIKSNIESSGVMEEKG